MRFCVFILKVFALLSICITLFIIVGIFIFLFVKGFSHISFSFIFDTPSGMILGSEGGIWSCITGSLLFTCVALLFAAPLAFSLAVINVFFIKNKKLKRFLQNTMQLLSGVPSILLGLFTYSIFVQNLGFGRCVISGSIALAIMIIPFIEIKLEKVFSEVEKKYYNASIALGCSRVFTIFHMVIPHMFGDIISAFILGACFAIGATAPIMFTGGVAFAKPPKTFFEPAMALPLHLYLLVQQGGSQIDVAYATASVMTALVFVINVCINIYTIRKKSKWQSS